MSQHQPLRLAIVKKKKIRLCRARPIIWSGFTEGGGAIFHIVKQL